MYFLPLRIMRERKSTLPETTMLKLYDVYSQEMLNLHVGQALDICWHSTRMSEAVSREPSIDNYLHMCANKTGGLARMSAKMSAIISGASDEQVEAIGKFAESIGIAFQIQDDILNIEETAALAQSKGGIGEDIHEGKRTIMVLHTFHTASREDAKRLKEILSLKTNDVKLIEEAINIMKRNGSIEFAKKKAEDLMLDAWNELDSFLEASAAKSKLKALVDYLIQRDT
jgi:geranylgeranyl pyrophosphate synthase